MAANEYSPAAQTYSQVAGGTAGILVAANPRRTSLWIQPQTENITINFGATAGVQATGTLTVTTNPDVNDTIAVNGVTFTFVASSASATQITIGATPTLTAANMATILNASVHASISIATYSSSGFVVTITHDAGGVDGNAFTLADSSGGDITRSAATLTGGLDTGNGFLVPVSSDRWLNCGEYASFREDIYINSATTAAKTVYLEGIGGA